MVFRYRGKVFSNLATDYSQSTFTPGAVSSIGVAEIEFTDGDSGRLRFTLDSGITRDTRIARY